MRGRLALLLIVCSVLAITFFVASSNGSAQNATNEPPTATIDSIYIPPPGKGDTVFFSGHGDDPDGEVVAFKWRSNVTGILSRNASFNVTNLTVGKHTIHFSVMDDNGTWSSEAVEAISLEEPCDDCDEEEDETAVPASSIAVVVTFVIVIVTMTIWFNLSRKGGG